jgi:hypothetical protein
MLDESNRWEGEKVAEREAGLGDSGAECKEVAPLITAGDSSNVLLAKSIESSAPRNRKNFFITVINLCNRAVLEKKYLVIIAKGGPKNFYVNYIVGQSIIF